MTWLALFIFFVIIFVFTIYADSLITEKDKEIELLENHYDQQLEELKLENEELVSQCADYREQYEDLVSLEKILLCIFEKNKCLINE